MASISDREKENALLLARLRDAVRLCRQRSCPQFVGFLDEHQQVLAQSLEKEMGSDSLCFYGGHSEAERTIAGFFPSYMGPDFTFFPIKSLSFSYRKDAVLQHRDFLGTMLSCGVRRDKIGDILCGTGFTVAFVNTEIADFLCDQIRKVGGEGVVVTDGFQGELPQAHHYKEIRDTVASPRLDAVVKAAIGASREEAAAVLQRERFPLITCCAKTALRLYGRETFFPFAAKAAFASRNWGCLPAKDGCF